MATQIWNATGTVVTFTDTTGDYAITLNNLATAAGRSSAVWDRSTGSKPSLYRWRAVMQGNAAPTVGNSVLLYLAYSDGTIRDGTLGSTDAALSSVEKVRNLELFGAVQADVSTGSVDFIASGLVEIYERYVTLVVLNQLGQALKASNNVNYVKFWPVPPELQ